MLRFHAHLSEQQTATALGIPLGTVKSFGGRLEIVADRCIGTNASEQPTLYVFPPGTTVTGSGSDLVVHFGTDDLRIGDEFEAGAESGTQSLADIGGDLDDEAPDSCKDLDALEIFPNR